MPPSNTLALIRRVRAAGIKPRKRPVPRPTPPTAIKLGYAGALVDVTAGAFPLAWAELERVVRPMLEGNRGDDDRVNRAIDRASDAFFRSFDQAKVEAAARLTAARSSRLTGENLARQARSALGIDIFQREPRLEAIVPAFISENVALIKSVPNRFFDEVEKLAANAVRTGRRWEDLAKDIQERTGIAEDRARLIARDQVGKLVGQLADERHKDLGLTHFIWRTVRDDRVREEHEALNGDRFEIGVGDPDEGLPGEAINCRCYEEPDFSTLLDAAV